MTTSSIAPVTRQQPERRPRRRLTAPARLDERGRRCKAQGCAEVAVTRSGRCLACFSAMIQELGI